jgi:cobalt-zinc-cadmium resistance protein CzcA
MLSRIISFSLEHRLLVLALVLAGAVAGGTALAHLNIDAFPDTTPIQVQINTAAPALGPRWAAVSSNSARN